jgi:hypothetical protein
MTSIVVGPGLDTLKGYSRIPAFASSSITLPLAVRPTLRISVTCDTEMMVVLFVLRFNSTRKSLSAIARMIIESFNQSKSAI